MRPTHIIVATASILLSSAASAGEILLAPGAQLTYTIKQSPRPAEAGDSAQSSYDSTCTIVPVEDGPSGFQAMALECDREWRCGSLRSDQSLAYTSAGLQSFGTRPGAQTTPADGTLIQASLLEYGGPFSLGGQTGFVQCQTEAVTPGNRSGRPNTPRPPQNRPAREVTTCSTFEAGITTVTAPFCSAELSAVVPASTAAAETSPASDPAPAPAPAAAAPPAGEPAMAFSPGAEGQEMNLLLGDGSTVLNPLDMMALNEAYCWASSTPTFQGVQAIVTYADLPESSTIEAQFMGSTAMIEDEDGYMMCDESELKLLGGASVAATGTSTQTIDLRTSAPMPTWPCAIELSAMVMKGSGDMVELVLEAESTEMWISCPE